MPNQRDLAVRQSILDLLTIKGPLHTSELLQTSSRKKEQSRVSFFIKLRFQYLKKVSGRLTRLLRGQDTVASQKPAIQQLLVVDDEQSLLFSMSEYFSQHGFRVDTARELGEVEKLIESTNYQVVIQDLRLGISRYNDGLDIIKLIHRRNPETRIVVLTSYGSNEIESEARRSGADAFLHKPKPLSQVAQVIQGLIEASGKRPVPSPLPK